MFWKRLIKKNTYKNYRIPNPTLHIVFNQIKLVINDIIRVYGQPTQVALQTERNLLSGQKPKNKNHKKIVNPIEKEVQSTSEYSPLNHEDMNHERHQLRYQLWKQQGGICVYSGNLIPKTQFYTSEWEVDHILPFSRSLDDSIFNKVLVDKATSREKGKQTPFEAFSSHQQSWRSIMERVNKLSTDKNNSFHEKKWRFRKNAMDIFLKREKLFLGEKSLRDFSVSHCFRLYLERVCDEVWTVSKKMTTLFQDLLGDSQKHRDDLRGYAKNTFINGLIDHSLIQSMTHIAKIIETQKKQDMEFIGNKMREVALPWKSFKEDSFSSLGKIIVSHRKRVKKENQLHDDTSYGLFKKKHLL